MKGIISVDKIELELINKKINDQMKLTIPNYNAIQWGKIVKHETDNTYVLLFEDDSRNPMAVLNQNEKSKHDTINEKSWIYRPV